LWPEPDARQRRLVRGHPETGGADFDQIFKNEELRQEFENLTRRLDAPSS
jgi:hypothetical protein